ncbi:MULTISPECIES: TetR/AcrR family transcriptional regulator [Nocardia]|uniref:TetR/AcrR family transcriptional regulator n=1 Tax=Nocardia TaxID=1817 RepID=UPI001894CCC4|nr:MULTISPECIES: TetR/AcrR family transcriptional regulator [Nocardia]MBF6351310.1 TetR/AcrR family transcriptional regulator C-terminal domain-containing protein [Nocardia flavorosea]
MAIPTVLELLWGTDRRPTRGPKPTLSRAAIVAAAVELADAEGLAAVSMQKLADRLGYTKMSLYRHIPGKTELTALMTEAALAGLPELDASGPQPWRSGLQSWAYASFERYRRHPWVMELLAGTRPVGPNELHWTEAALDAMADIALTGPERLDTLVVLNGHVRSLAQQLVGPGVTEEEFTGAMAAALEMAGDRFPRVIEAISDHPASGRPTGSTHQRDAALEFGIERILDGVEALLTRRTRR